jgi:hypothetical protein
MYPRKYIPNVLSKSDKQKQLNMLNKSKQLYKRNKYFTRKKISSYKYKPSNHIINAKKMYHVSNITPNKQLSKATGCSISALQQIVKKGEGAYYSSGSRPNQTPQSWGNARLASAITAGNASIVDYHILKTCNKTKKAYRLATKKYNSRKT